MADVKLNLDASSEFLPQLQKLSDELKELRSEVNQYRTESSKAFKGSAKSINDATKEVNEQAEAIKRTEKEVENLRKEQSRLERESKTAYDTKAVDRYGKSIKGLGNLLKTVGIVAIFQQGLSALRSFVEGGVNAYLTQVQSIAKVEQAISSTGGAAGRSLEDLKKQATDLQRNTLFGDESILNGVTAQLLTFTNIADEQFDRTQKVALDLSTVLDGDLQSASIQLGKALNDPVANLSALSRSGIQFSKDQQATIKTLAETNRLSEAQSVILSELERQYGGQAEAAAKANGGFKQTANILGDLQEAIGGKIVGSLQNYNVSIQEAAIRTIEWVETSAGADFLFATFKATIDGLIDVFAEYGSVLSRLGDSTDALLSKLGLLQGEGEKTSAAIDGIRFALELSAVPFKVIVGIIDNIVTGFGAIVEGGKLAIDFFSDFSLDNGAEAFKKAVGEFEQSVTNVVNDVASPFVGLFEENQSDVDAVAEESAKQTAKIYGKSLGDTIKAEDQRIVDARIKSQEKFLADVLKLEQDAEAERVQSLTGEARIEAEAKQRQAQIKVLEQTLQEELNLVELSGEERIAAEERIRTAISELVSESNKQAQSDLRAFRIQEAQKNLQLNQELAEAEAESLRLNLLDQGKTAEEAERAKQEQLIQIQIKYAEQRLALLQGQGGIEAETQRVQLQNLIGDLENQLGDVQSISVGNGEPLLQQVLGVGDEEFTAIKQSVGELISVVGQALQQNLNAAIENNQSYISLLDTRISETENALNREVELRDKGLASNVQAEEESLEQLKAKRREAIAEQEKLQKRQATIDALTQASALATAGAKIFAAEAGKGLLGVAFGISAIATLISFFQRFKTQSKAAASLEKGGFGDSFGLIDGKRHSQGGENFRDHIEVEAGEGWSVYNRKAYRKYGKQLKGFTEGINRGNPTEAIQSMLKGTGVALGENTPAMVFSASYQPQFNRENSELRRELASVKDELVEMKNLMKEWPKRFIDKSSGNEYMKQGFDEILIKKDGNT